MESKLGIFVRWDGQKFIPQKFTPNFTGFEDDPNMEFVEILGTDPRDPLEGDRYIAVGKRREP